MHHADVDTDLMKQRQLFGNRSEILAVLGYFTGQFDNKSLSLEALYVRQRLAQQIQA